MLDYCSNGPCNKNGKCDSDETAAWCPEDCCAATYSKGDYKCDDDNQYRTQDWYFKCGDSNNDGTLELSGRLYCTTDQTCTLSGCV